MTPMPSAARSAGGSSEGSTPGGEISLQYAMIPWVCLAVAVVGLAAAAWTYRFRHDVWGDMGRVFDEV